MTQRKYQAALTEIASQYGFAIARASKHLIWKNAAGKTVVSPTRSTCRRSIRNFESNVRRVAAACAWSQTNDT